MQRAAPVGLFTGTGAFPNTSSALQDLIVVSNIPWDIAALAGM
jgi:hypothetical protein